MTNVFSLADIDKALAEQYAPLELVVGKTTYKIRQLLRMNSGERNVIAERLAGMDTGDDSELTEDDIRESMEFALSTATADGKGPDLIKALDGDLLRLKYIFEKWSEITQAGEA
jgi:hypothetical protein